MEIFWCFSGAFHLMPSGTNIVGAPSYISRYCLSSLSMWILWFLSGWLKESNAGELCVLLTGLEILILCIQEKRILAQDVCVREAMTWLGTHVVFTLILLGFLYMEEKKYISAFSVEEQGSCLLLLNFILKISNNREKKKRQKENKINACGLWHWSVSSKGLHLSLLKVRQHVFGLQHFQFWNVWLEQEINHSSLWTGK